MVTCEAGWVEDGGGNGGRWGICAGGGVEL